MSSSESKQTTKMYKSSKVSQRTSNPIRKIVDQLQPPKNCTKAPIALSIGDPTKFKNLRTHKSVSQALMKAAESTDFDGYPHSCGYLEARRVVAEYAGGTGGVSPALTPEQVILTSGCSGALEIVIAGLADEGDNILLPRPGFSLYNTLCSSKGIQVRYYDLVPEAAWQVNVDHARSLVDEKTRAILVNNPSNPCGSVYSREHLLEILAMAEDCDIPIIADEIYADMVFDPSTNPFIPLASLSVNVPILSVGGIAKRFLVPGWRLGWILIHDRHGKLVQVAEGLVALTTLILGPNSLVQATLPNILLNTPKSFFDNTMHTLKSHGTFLAQRLSSIPGLNPICPQGAMYMMVHIDLALFSDISDDIDFAKKLYAEENVCVLPGQCFEAPSYVRLVTCPSLDILRDACNRIESFVQAHLLPS